MIRQFVRALGTALLIAGVALILDAALTVVWQEPISAAYSAIVRGKVDDELGELEARGPATSEAEALNLNSAREQADRKMIRHALARSEGNISNTAKLLGISRPTLYDLLRQYDLQA